MLSTSLTEALPIALIEAMANKTPFVATPVGAVTSLGAGLIAASIREQKLAIENLLTDQSLWLRLSELGYLQYLAKYTRVCVVSSLSEMIESIKIDHLN